MSVGQLIKVESFSLFDAMCAIVIMDPKMDTGMVLDDYLTRPQYDINRLIDPKEFIWIFDNILVGQMTWLSGHALSQTLFTSCYILRLFEIELDENLGRTTGQEQEQEQEKRSNPPPQLVSLVLKSCVLAIAKSCGLIWEEMRKGQVYEEEDFMTNKFGVSLYENFPAASLFAMLDQAEYWMQKLGTHWIRSRYDDKEATEIVDGLMDRIYFSRFGMAIGELESARQYLQALKRTHYLGKSVDDAFDHAVHRKLVTSTPPRAIALLSSDETFDQLDQMFADLAFIANALQFTDTSNLVNFFIHFGSQKPAPGAFPRSVLQTVLYDDRVIMGSRPVQTVVRDSIQETVVPEPWIFEGFNKLHEHLDLNDPSGLQTIPELEEDEMSSLKRQIQAKAVAFVEKAVKPFVDTLQIMGQNTSRQRRNLRKIILLWEGLQEDAELFDEEIHMVADEIRIQQEQGLEQSQESAERPFFFVSWVYHMKLWVMEWMMLLGAELELYSDFEYSMVYGYVEYVSATHTRHLQRVQRVQAVLSSDAHKKKKKKKKGSDEKPSGSAPNNTRSESVILELAAVKANLARGVFLVLATLTNVGHLSTTPPHLASHGLNNLETLFAHRFKAFRNLSSPEILTYSNYLRRMECDGYEPQEVLEYASKLLNEAKSSLDRLHSLSAKDARAVLCEEAWRKDIKGMAKVCIASKVAITNLQKDARVLEMRQIRLDEQKRLTSAASKPTGMGKTKGKSNSQVLPPTTTASSDYEFKTPTRRVSFEWQYHPWWPVVSLKP
ncbi:hypothetical protein BGX28_007344 [Mortierella sp. GBA30]|nr:hypothetical protein BGX28_007344 [Mortierella sp. GBA30]